MQGIECAGAVSSKYGIVFAQASLGTSVSLAFLLSVTKHCLNSDDICGSYNVASILDYGTALP